MKCLLWAMSLSIVRMQLALLLCHGALTTTKAFTCVPRTTSSRGWDVVRAVEDDDDARQEEVVPVVLEPTEKAWRWATKVLLRIGSKGATVTHGNSLRQLLQQHQVVKVKINTRKYGGLDEAFVIVRDLAVEAGAPEGIEFLHSRASENTILLGLPGTKAAIDAGTFPPPPPPLWIPKETKIVDKTDRSK